MDTSLGLYFDILFSRVVVTMLVEATLCILQQAPSICNTSMVETLELTQKSSTSEIKQELILKWHPANQICWRNELKIITKTSATTKKSFNTPKNPATAAEMDRMLDLDPFFSSPTPSPRPSGCFGFRGFRHLLYLSC